MIENGRIRSVDFIGLRRWRFRLNIHGLFRNHSLLYFHLLGGSSPGPGFALLAQPPTLLPQYPYACRYSLLPQVDPAACLKPASRA